MNKKAKQLRELVNKKLPERLKLEFGCEVYFKEPKYDLIKVRYTGNYIIIQKEYHDRGNRFELFMIENTIQLNDNNLHTIGSKEISQLEELNLIEVFGKPISLEEILLLSGKKDKEYKALIDEEGWFVSFNILNFKKKKLFKIDLTKPIEEQDDEVLDKLIKLIK